MKNNKGITLIALVVTIIVLLILAGISIAMLTGDNGILSNASNAKSQNAYYGAEEQMKLVYMAIRTEIAAKTVASSSYDATADEANLMKVVKKDLASDGTNYDTGWKETAPAFKVVNAGEKATITLTYTDSAIAKDSISKGKPTQDGKVVGIITLGPQTASFEFDK